MPVTTREAVLATAPELAAIPADDPRWGQAIADAEANMAAARWGRLLEQGARYFVAHRLTISRQASAGRGPVVAEGAGGVTRSYAAPGGAPGEMGSTPYGQEFRRLARMVGGGPR